MSGSPHASSDPVALGVSAALCDGELVAGDVLVQHGRVAAVGTPDELRERTGEQLFERVFLRLIGEDPDQ